MPVTKRAVNSRIPEELLRRLKIQAVHEDRPVGDLVADAVEAYLRAHPVAEQQEAKAS